MGRNFAITNEEAHSRIFNARQSGLDVDTGEPMVWRYLNDYDNNEIIDFMSLLNPHTNYKSKNNTQQND